MCDLLEVWQAEVFGLTGREYEVGFSKFSRPTCKDKNGTDIGYSEVFGVADFMNEVEVTKFIIADPTWRIKSSEDK